MSCNNQLKQKKIIKIKGDGASKLKNQLPVDIKLYKKFLRKKSIGRLNHYVNILEKKLSLLKEEDKKASENIKTRIKITKQNIKYIGKKEEQYIEKSLSDKEKLYKKGSLLDDIYSGGSVLYVKK